MIRNWVVYFFSVLGAWMLAILYQHYYTVVFAILVSFLPLVGGILFMLIAIRIRFSFYIPKRMVTSGEKVPYVLELQRNYFLPLTSGRIYYHLDNSFMGISKKCQASFACPGGWITPQGESLEGLEEGKNTISLKQIVFYDFFGLFFCKYKIQSKVFVMVLPKEEEEVAGEFLGQEFFDKNIEEEDHYRTDRPGDDRTEIFDLRNYRDGDDVKNIYWKLFGRRQEMIVKEFSEPIQRMPVLVCNYRLSKEEEKDKDRRAFYGAALQSVLFTLQKIGKPFFLAWMDGNQFFIKKINRVQVEQLLEILLDVAFTEKECNPHDLSRFLKESIEQVDFNRIWFLTPGEEETAIKDYRDGMKKIKLDNRNFDSRRFYLRKEEGAFVLREDARDEQ